ncbi:hypothetical protein Q1Z72_19550 [Pseudomonas qingdaonensis]|nr:hypothetical protein [Pseudomonas qingdaonensis]WKL65485.1 hypothetical protein Q1Z72_19550 [Pseudomonas qingdaonensis]
MSTALAFFILAVMLVASGAVLAWGAAVARKRSYEEFILRKSKRAGGGQ